VDATPEALKAGVYASRFRTGTATLWTIVNRGTVDFTGHVIDADGEGTVIDVTAGTALDGLGSEIVVPARGVSGVLHVVGDVPPGVEELLAAARADRHSDDCAFPERASACVATVRSASRAPDDDVITLSAGTQTLRVQYRVRETGMYAGAPFVEEWKPLPPRLHAEAAEEHAVEIGSVAVAAVEVTGADGAPLTGLSLTEARAHAASLGARLPTEFEWQLAAADPAFRRAEPLVWNWTESERSDGITRYAILKGGCAFEAQGSEWYFDGGPRPPEFSAKLLLAGLGLDHSPSIGFRLAWDL
jgi:hypothetical protein